MPLKSGRRFRDIRTGTKPKVDSQAGFLPVSYLQTFSQVPHTHHDTLVDFSPVLVLSLIHISEPTRPRLI
eukprot:1573519-Rhodomonas_salina.1